MTKTVARAKIASLRIFSAVSDPIRASPLIKLRRGSRCENGITHFTLPCTGRVAHRRCAEWGRAILRRGSVCPYPRASLANLPPAGGGGRKCRCARRAPLQGGGKADG